MAAVASRWGTYSASLMHKQLLRQCKGVPVAQWHRQKLQKTVLCTMDADNLTWWGAKNCKPSSWVGTQPRYFSGVCEAKKGKKGGKKGKKKGSLMDIPAKPAIDPWKSTSSIMLLLMLAECFKRATGKSLMEDADIAEIANDVWEAAFCMIASNATESDEPPQCVYINKPGLECLDLQWSDVVDKPTSELPEAVLSMFGSWKKDLESATGDVIEDYSLKVNDFEIKDATLLVLKSPTDKPLGQILIFKSWKYEDGSKGGVGITDPKKVPTAEDVAEAEKLVNEQGQVIRALKEENGLTNQDEEVKAAVAILMERKENLANLQKLLDEAPTS